MDPVILAAAVSALFGLMVKERNDRLADKDKQLADLRKEKDDQIAKLESRIASLEQRTDTFDQILTRNTDALSQSAESMNVLVGAIKQGRIGMTLSETATS